jgi:amino acid adenylation domain-containing protein
MKMALIKTADQIISQGAKLYGRRVAYEHNGETLDFIQLAHDADRLSHELNLAGVIAGEPVAVVVEKSLNFIRALAAILKAGAIYLPIDTKNPDDRMRYILRDSGAKHVVTMSANVPRLNDLIDPGVRLFLLDCSEDVPIKSVTPDRKPARQRLRGSDLAYIIYTSGSTNMPKGVAIRHESLLNYIEQTVKTYGFDNKTSLLCVKSFSYDASLTDIFCPFYAGGVAHLMNEGLVLPPVIEERLVRHGITHISCTPAVMRLLAEKGSLSPEVYATVKTMSVGGDVVPPRILRKIQDTLPHIRLFNRYGPTETTVTCCTYELKENVSEDGVIPIGKPHKNVCLRAVNQHGKTINVNEVGELYVGGVQVMAGYWGARELTAKVITDSFGDGLRYYKTSDLVSINENGDYIFVRRLDNVVKKNGFRVSLDEVEAAILRGGVADECVCVFVPEESTGGSAKIVAYLRSAGAPISDQDLREQLRVLLPAHMVPDVFTYVSSIPRELSGKPARQELKRQSLSQSGDRR